jgi:hypothetical protein
MMETQGNTPVPLEQGLASLNADGVGDVDKLAEGGVIGYADGGGVLGMADGVPRNWQDYWNYSPVQSSLYDAWSYDPENWKVEGPGRPLPEAIGMRRRQPKLTEASAPQGGISQFTQMSPAIELAKKFTTQPSAPRGASGSWEEPPKPAAKPAPKGGLELLNAPPDQLAQIQAGIDARRAASPPPAAQAPAGIADVAPQAAEGRLSFADELKRASSAAEAAGQYTAPEMKAIEDLVSKRRQTSEADAEKRRSTALGLGALFAASELMQSGRTSTSSLGEAMKAVGKQGMEFTKEEQRIKDKLDEGDLSLAQAKLAFKKGNYESGLKLLESHDKRALEAAKIAGDKAYHDGLLEVQRLGLEGKDKDRYLEQKRFEAEMAVKQNLYSAHADYYRAAAGAKGGITPAVRAQIADRAADNARARTNKPSQMAQLKLDPRYKGMADEEIRQAIYIEELTKATSGIGALTPSFVNPAFREGEPPEGAVIRPLAKP